VKPSEGYSAGPTAEVEAAVAVNLSCSPINRSCGMEDKGPPTLSVLCSVGRVMCNSCQSIRRYLYLKALIQ
jgi:hypothetical protein